MAARTAIQLDLRDSVATALVPLSAGETVALETVTVALAENIPSGHKFAVRPIAKDEAVIKYGQPIGRATKPIQPGEHVHVHNVVSQRAVRESGVGG
ncbi:MAG TPA: UxaA family hydrolase [Planctomycetota bacterium]|nr:UxaA family hydrolase [Planctomycetota bacterium]